MNETKNLSDAIKEKIIDLAKALTNEDENSPATKKLFDSLALVVTGVQISQQSETNA
jgi:hypothetical protein